MEGNGWKNYFQFKLNPKELCDFDEECEFHQNEKGSFLKNNTVSGIVTEEGVIVTWGQSLCKRKYVDPYTEQVTSVIEAKTEEEFKDLIKKEMGIVIDFPLCMKDEDLIGFTDESSKHDDEI